MDIKTILKKAEKYKYLALIVAVGLLLLLWNPGASSETPAPASGLSALTEDFSLAELERRLEETLGKTEGVGRVQVVLTLKSSTEVVYSRDETDAERREMEGGSLSSYETDSQVKTVILSGSSGSSQPLVIKRIYPEFQGAVVVCDGGASASVKLRVLEAVASVTGLGADKIAVMPMKQ